MKKMKIGFIGAGSRVVDYYLPILDQLERFEVAGFNTRSEDTAKRVATSTGMKHMTIADLNDVSDVLFVIVPANAISGVVQTIMDQTDKPLVIETPVMSEHIARMSWERRNNRQFFAAENWPYRPMNIVMKMIIDAGIIGNVNTVVNDFRGYEYHAFAMMRALAEGGRSTPRATYPTSVIGATWSSGMVDLVTDKGESKRLQENWDIGIMQLNNGVRLIHNFNSVHSRTGARGPRSLRIMGTDGFIGADDTVGAELTITRDGRPVPVDIEIVKSGDILKSIDVDVEGKKFTYDGCNAPFDDQQHSTRLMLEELHKEIVGGQNAWTYDAWKSWVDWNCVQGLRYSASKGQMVTYPNVAWMV